jgi:hypothetical protein
MIRRLDRGRPATRQQRRIIDALERCAHDRYVLA